MNTTTKGWLLLAAAILAEVTGSLTLKGALEYPALYAVVAVGYLGAFALLAVVLRTGMALGVAYGIWAAAGVALTAIISRFLFKEPLTWLMGLGIILIIGGVLLIELGATH
ncbi:DMT family transporter [Arthrobacter sp. MDT1-65]